MELLKQIWMQTGFGFSDIHLEALLVAEMDGGARVTRFMRSFNVVSVTGLRDTR